MANENGRLGTPVFYKFIVGVFTLLLVSGVIGVYNTNIKLAKIEIKLENLEKVMADRFTSTQGKELTNDVIRNTRDIEEVSDRLNEHLLWAAGNNGKK
tara:strand:- start:1514 stop:1807 length:294 start_codon:yes stop_codon:yes gene_type:complete